MVKESKESNSERGGKRAGSGRKPSTIKGIVKRLPKESAALILDEIKANKKWVDLANSEDERIVLEVLKYLTDRANGKARQAVEVTGEDGGPVQTAINVTFVKTNGPTASHS